LIKLKESLALSPSTTSISSVGGRILVLIYEPPGDNRKPIHLVEPNAPHHRVTFATALKRAIDALKPSNITLIGPIFEQPFDVPDAMIRTAMWKKEVKPMARAV